VKASSLSFKAAVLFAMTGMAMGIAMAATNEDKADISELLTDVR
jgi:hypothetical protein